MEKNDIIWKDSMTGRTRFTIRGTRECCSAEVVQVVVITGLGLTNTQIKVGKNINGGLKSRAMVFTRSSTWNGAVLSFAGTAQMVVIIGSGSNLITPTKMAAKNGGSFS